MLERSGVAPSAPKAAEYEDGTRSGTAIPPFAGHQIVILGAGSGGLTCTLRLGRKLQDRVDEGEARIVLVDCSPYHVLEMRLHEAAARGAEVTIPVARFLQRRPVRFLQHEVTGVEHRSRVVETAQGGVPYDAQSLKPHVDSRFARARREPDAARGRQLRRVVIGGAGITGVELATELADRIRHLLAGPGGSWTARASM